MSGPVRVKLYLRETGDDYAEAYADFDLPHHKLVFAEANPRYRGALIRWFEEGAQ